jgi:uncharacterized protein
MRYVFDTNVIISAFLFEGGSPAIALRFGMESGGILLSLGLLEEISKVLVRDKFKRYFRTRSRDELLQTLSLRASLIDISVTVNQCRDPKDNHILELAISGNANYIISGDRDLLTMNPFQGITIISVEQFLRSINI